MENKEQKRKQKVAQAIKDKKIVDDTSFAVFQMVEDFKEDVEEKIDTLKKEFEQEQSPDVKIEKIAMRLAAKLSAMEKGDPGEPGQDGDNYILTYEDKVEIAKSIIVPIVEREIETIREIETRIEPVVTENVVEKAMYEDPTTIANKLNTLNEIIEPKVIKGLLKTIADISANIAHNAVQAGHQLYTGVSETRVRELITLLSNSLPSQAGNNGKFLTTNGTVASWATISGGGDMLASTYDPANIAEQLVGLTASQTLSNKTFVAPALGTPASGVATNLTGTASGLTAGAVTNATFTTALTVNTGTLTLTANAANTSVLTIGAGAVSVSGSNTGDQTTISGNAGSATILQNTRTIWGQNFNGSANVTGDITLGTANITMTGSLAATGARVTKGWFTDLESTNMPTVGGTAILTSLTAPQFTTIELGHASDTTLSRVSAGVVAIEGVNILTTATGAAIAQTFYIGTTQVAINRASAALTLAGITLTTPDIGTPSAGVGTNITGITAAHVLAGTLGTGAYTMDTSLTVPQVFNTDHAIACSSNAATVTRAYRNNVVTNDSAANMTITMSTSGATGGDEVVVQILDFSGVAKSITWVNTENSDALVPTTSNGSTTLPRSVVLKWNTLTSKWRCLANA
jgi:hypothetical protein